MFFPIRRFQAVDSHASLRCARNDNCSIFILRRNQRFRREDRSFAVISPKNRRKKSETSRINFLNCLQGILLPPFGDKRWCQKCLRPTPAARAETACGLCRARRRKPSAAKVWHLRRERASVLTERARKIFAVCAHPLRAFEPPSALFPSTVPCGG